MGNFVNFLSFQCGWFACMFAAANGQPSVAALCSLAVVALHLRLTHASRVELKLLGAAALIGAIWENALALAGWTKFPGGVEIAGLAPAWMVTQWMMFSTTLNHSLAWLKPWPRIATILGAASGPLAYLAGERLGAIELTDRHAALFALAAGWAIFTPLLLALARRWGNVSNGDASTALHRAQHA